MVSENLAEILDSIAEEYQVTDIHDKSFNYEQGNIFLILAKDISRAR